MEKKNIAEGYDKIAREVFLPIFPMIARQALKVYGREDGVCLDLGCGGGMFGFFLALLSDMDVHFLDVQEDAIALCRQRGEDWGLSRRCEYFTADVHNMPLSSNSYPLIVSRGSLPFWGQGEESLTAFREIYRVLAPGGVTLIGGSLGTPDMGRAIDRRMEQFNPEWNKKGGSAEKSCVNGFEAYSRMLRSIDIPHSILMGDSGSWIIMKKPNAL